MGENVIKCPHCKEDIASVHVFSKCWQVAELDGKKLVNYGSVEDVLETLSIECPECGRIIDDEVEE